MINLKNVYAAYGETQVLNGVDLTISQGDFVALTGANGAGKSTVSKLIRGLVKPTGGTVEISNKDISGIQSSVLANEIGFLFQNPDRQICKNTVEEEVKFGLELTLADKATHNQKCKDILEKFNLEATADPFCMSRGQRQRVALASVLVCSPKILILDEPTTGLDYKECIQIMEEIKHQNENGVTVIMVCHDMEIVLDYAKTVVVMNKGTVVAKGPCKEILCNTPLLKQASLLPPQIIRLANKLGDKYKNIFTPKEMADYIYNTVKGES